MRLICVANSRARANGIIQRCSQGLFDDSVAVAINEPRLAGLCQPKQSDQYDLWLLQVDGNANLKAAQEQLVQRLQARLSRGTCSLVVTDDGDTPIEGTSEGWSVAFSYGNAADPSFTVPAVPQQDLPVNVRLIRFARGMGLANVEGPTAAGSTAVLESAISDWPSRELIARSLGTPSDKLVLKRFLRHAAGRCERGVGDSTLDSATQNRVLTLATLLRTATYLATRSFEGRPIVCGIVATADDNLISNEAFVFKYRKPRSLDLAPASRAERIAQLSDGSLSYVSVGAMGQVHGLIAAQGRDIREITGSFRGRMCGIAITHNRGVNFYCCGNAILHHTGFEWRCDTPWHQMKSTGDWLFRHEGASRNDVVRLLDRLSLLRLPSIIVLAHRSSHQRLQKAGVVESLRPGDMTESCG